MSKPAKPRDPKPLDPRRRAFLASLPRKLRNELERALTLDGDAARRAATEAPSHSSPDPDSVE